jgi:hypothetical protein
MYSMETTHRIPTRPAKEEEEAGVALYVVDKNKT